MRINRSIIVSTALELLDAYGLGDVTMRRIAVTLGVAPGALYWHIENKQALIAALGHEILHPVVAFNQTPEVPEIQEVMRTFRGQALAVRDGAEVIAAAITYPSLHAEVVATLRRAVEAAGAPAGCAETLLNFAIGSVVTEQGARQAAEAAGTQPPDETAGADDFDRGARTILSGARLEAASGD